MNLGLTHIGAVPHTPVLAGVPGARAGADAPAGPAAPSETRFQVSAVRPTPPAIGASQAREQIRDQIMAERGVDLLTLYKLSSQDRIRTEASIAAETALRAAQARATPLASFIDLRV